jgi:toxin FitB
MATNRYLIDTNVVSELRKDEKADPGVRRFFQQAEEDNAELFVSVVTIGELRRGVEIIRHRGDRQQADRLDAWLETVLRDHADNILDFTSETAQMWGRLRVPHYENALDKQIAATALTHGLTLVTRNGDDFLATRVALLNPFQGGQ